MDESFGFPAQLAQFLKIQRMGADLENVRNKSKFEFQVGTWKSETLHWQNVDPSKVPASKPEVPQMKSVNEQKAQARFSWWYHNPERVDMVFDFFDFAPMVLAADFWDLTPKGPAADPNQDPVAGPDGSIPGQFLVTSGDTFPIGSIITHPVHGVLKKTGQITPFGSWFRWNKV